MRRTVTSWERPSTGILNNFTCKEGTHLVNIILIFFKKTVFVYRSLCEVQCYELPLSEMSFRIQRLSYGETV